MTLFVLSHADNPVGASRQDILVSPKQFWMWKWADIRRGEAFCCRSIGLIGWLATG